MPCTFGFFGLMKEQSISHAPAGILCQLSYVVRLLDFTKSPSSNRSVCFFAFHFFCSADASREMFPSYIREGVEYTSAVCVLIGTETWLRRWVKYEIARAVIDGRGLLAVHLNSIRHHHTKTPHTRGYNPLDFMAVGKVQPGVLSTPSYYLFEQLAVPNGIGGYKWEWHRYNDYISSVSLPAWVADPLAGYVTPLSQNATVHDYIPDDGHRNIGSWIDKAAQGAGR
jgi:hypothetical protein